MPVIRVSMWAGRSKEQKRQIVEAFTKEMGRIADVRPEALHIIFEDVPKENWGYAGKLSSETPPK
jgi:4-oxalocrotonate tautomerase